MIGDLPLHPVIIKGDGKKCGSLGENITVESQ